MKTLKGRREQGKFCLQMFGDTHVSVLLPNMGCIASRTQALSPY